MRRIGAEGDWQGEYLRRRNQAGENHAALGHRPRLQNLAAAEIYELNIMKRFNLTGQRFGRLLVGNFITKPGRGEWECLCDCGKTILAQSAVLRSGNTKSCGCYQKEKAAAAKTKHSKARTPEWNCWIGLRRRCLKKTFPKYPRYGGRGIKVCDRWVDSFENFLADMGPRPSSKHSIERKDNDGDYCPENCEWALPEKQCNNKSSSVLITYEGVTRTASQWAPLVNLPAKLIQTRIRQGWHPVKAITQPARITNRTP